MLDKKQTLLLGAHVSIAGGLDEAIYRGISIGCSTIQIFTKSNRQWAAKPLTDNEIVSFKKTLSESIIESVVAHAAYLINIASENESTRIKSKESLREELERCQLLEIPYLILHPGTNNEKNITKSLDIIGMELDAIFDKTPGSSMILLETMAGQGSNLCYSFDHIAYILNKSSHKHRLGVCLDTCHIFAAGYDLRNQESYNNLWNTFNTIIGLENLKVIHLNDSKKELGSKVDRHEHIGEGKLGLEPFRLLMNDSRFFSIPKILETPKENLLEDLKNMKTLVGLLSPETKNKLKIHVID